MLKRGMGQVANMAAQSAMAPQTAQTCDDCGLSIVPAFQSAWKQDKMQQLVPKVKNLQATLCPEIPRIFLRHPCTRNSLGSITGFLRRLRWWFRKCRNCEGKYYHHYGCESFLLLRSSRQTFVDLHLEEPIGHPREPIGNPKEPIGHTREPIGNPKEPTGHPRADIGSPDVLQ